MDNVNLSLVFISLTILVGAALVFALEKKGGKSTSGIYVAAFAWVALQAFLSIRGFYSEGELGYRMLLAVLPAILAVLFVAFSGKYSELRAHLPLRWLIIFQVVRVPIEFLRHLYNEHGTIPTLMTWEGRNYDVFAGLSAILIYWLYRENRISRNVVLIWNIACLGLLLYALFLSIFSTPSAFQLFAHNTPNVEILHFPLIWLPSFIIPLELLAHIISIEKVLKPSMTKKKSRFKK
jgi:hypothetical protein